MILKGSQRGNGGDLAIHLMNGYDNERVEIAEIHGTVADDLHGAFAEFEAVAAGTRAKQPLYSLSINPSAPLTRDQYHEAIAEIEQRLGLAGQPRAIVFHVKNGREHCHVVWSRIDAEKMRAIHMAHDRRRLCDLSCELAHKYGLELPPGLKAWEKKQRFEKQKLEPTLAENAQAAKTGISPEQRRKEITAAYERSDSAEGFRAALAQQGYILARGDRRGFVVVDKFADVHSLSRYVDGHTARQIKQKLAALAPEDLPSVDQAKELVRARGEKQSEGQGGDKARALAEKAHEAARQALADKQAERRTALAAAEQDMLVRQASEKLTLHAAQEEEKKRLLFRVRSAVAELIARTPGLRSVLGHIQKLTHLDPNERHVLEREALARRHEREKLDIERRRRGLEKVEAREKRSLDNALSRSAEQARTIGQKAAQDFYDAARDDGLWRKREFKEGELSVEFNDAGGFVEGADDPDGDDRALNWKARTQKIQRGRRPRRGKGPGYRREDD